MIGRRARWVSESDRLARVLVVDDDEGIVVMLCETLQQAGLGTFGATSASDALEFLRDASDELDAVVVDEGLPSSSGTELLRLVHEEHPHVLRVLMTGWVTKAIEGAERDGTIERVIEKPWLHRAVPELIVWIRAARRPR